MINFSKPGWIPSLAMEMVRSDDDAKKIFNFLNDRGYKNIKDFYPDARFNQDYVLLAGSAAEILEKIEDYGTL